MENFKLKIESGHYIELTESDMCQINSYYEVQCTADYLRENHPDWEEEKIQEIANNTRDMMNDYGYDEEEAIEEATSEWEEENADCEDDYDGYDDDEY